MIVKTQAIVLRMFPFSETSRIVTWLTADYGKISTMMKGSQRHKSLFLGQFDFFYTCQLLFYLRAYQGMHIVKECSPVKARESFRTTWKATACASYVSDLVSRICPFHAPHPEIYQWLESTLDFFASQRRFEKGLFWFELKLMEAMGMSPQFNICLKCKRPLRRADFNPNIAPVRRNVRPSGFDVNDLRRSCSGLTLSKVRKHCVETSAREASRTEVLMKRAREYSCNKQVKPPAHLASHNTRPYLFSFQQGGMYCYDCSAGRPPDAIEMTPDIMGILRFWQGSKTWLAAQRSKCTTRQLEAIENILGLLLQYHLRVDISSRNMALDILRMKSPA